MTIALPDQSLSEGSDGSIRIRGVSIRDRPDKPFRGIKEVKLRIAVDFRAGSPDFINDYGRLFQTTW